MAVRFLLTDVGEGLTEAEIVRWLVAVGDSVKEDQPLVEIQTDKAVTEMPAPVTGVVAELGGREGDLLHVGDMLLVIDDGKAAVTIVGGAHGDSHAAAPVVGGPVVVAAGQPAPVSPTAVSPTAVSTTAEVAGAPVTSPAVDAPASASTRPLATPSTRALARSMGIDLRSVLGTGAGGRISDDDVRAAAPPAAPAANPVARVAPPASVSPVTHDDERVPFRGIRRRTAENMTAAWQNVPHVSSFAEVDVDSLFALRRELRPIAAEHGIELTLTAFFVKATALALREFPDMNASLDLSAGEIVRWGHRHIGVAVDTDGGLVLPVIRDADAVPLLAIAADLGAATATARDRSLSLAAMSGGTFTISNYGPLGGWFGTSLVHNAEVGVLGFGPAVDKPIVRDGVVVPGKVMVLNAGADHRVVDGRQIIGFVTAVKNMLQHPTRLLLEGI